MGVVEATVGAIVEVFYKAVVEAIIDPVVVAAVEAAVEVFYKAVVEAIIDAVVVLLRLLMHNSPFQHKYNGKH